MLPFFNTAGPCIPVEHYMLPPERRLGSVLELVEARRFFTLHAGRQTGYLDHTGLTEGWLVLFDLRTTKSWAERLTVREVEHRGKRVHVVGC